MRYSFYSSVKKTSIVEKHTTAAITTATSTTASTSTSTKGLQTTFNAVKKKLKCFVNDTGLYCFAPNLQ